MLRRDCGPATSSRPGQRNSTDVSSPSRRPCTSHLLRAPLLTCAEKMYPRPTSGWSPTLQYPDFVHLLSSAWCVVSDSGGVQEEAPTFGLQILITRDNTERPEVVEAGFGRLVASDYSAIVQGVRGLTSSNERQVLAKL